MGRMGNKINSEGRRVKVVQVIADSEIGGGPRHILGLLEHLDKAKFESFLICPPGYLAQEARKIKGVRVDTVRFASKFDLASCLVLRRKLESIRADNDPFGPMIIHVHGSRASLMARLLKVRGVRYVYTEHRFDSGFHLKNRVNEWIQKRLLRIANFQTDLIIAVSSSVKRFLVDEKMAPENRVVVIPNGISAGQLVSWPAGRAGWSAGQRDRKKQIIIGTVGNLFSVKGQRYLIEAFAEIAKDYPKARLEIVGEGPEHKSLKMKVESEKLQERISILGRVNKPKKRMRDWDVFVLPSLAETFGIVILEAFAAGLPVVATNVGGIPDIIENNRDGLLVPSRDPSSLASAIKEVLKDDKLAKKLVENGEKRLRDFNWTAVIRKVEDIYAKLA